MANTLRGDGLLDATRALAALVENPRRLNHERGRFSRSPAPHSDGLSSTRSQSFERPSEEKQREEKRVWDLKKEHRASWPYYQFEAQKRELERQEIDQDPNWGSAVRVAHPQLAQHIHNIVKQRWVDQGIWNEAWDGETDGLYMGKWKHEEPCESGSEVDLDVEDKHSTFSPPARAKAKANCRRPMSDERQAMADGRLAWRYGRDASRPFEQFNYQVSMECKRLQDEIKSSGRTELMISIPPNISTTAYETVRGTWIERGIWNRKWGILPGMSWKHEQPLHDFLLEWTGEADGSPNARQKEPPETVVPAATADNEIYVDGRGAEMALLRRDLFEALTEPSHSQVHSTPNTPPQQSPAPADAMEYLNGNINYSSTRLPLIENRKDGPSSTVAEPRRSARSFLTRNPTAHSIPGPARPSSVSKSRQIDKLHHRLSASILPSDTLHSPKPVIKTRKSTRLQKEAAGNSAAEATDHTSLAHSLNNALKSRLRARNDSARSPQGISKKPRLAKIQRQRRPK